MLIIACMGLEEYLHLDGITKNFSSLGNVIRFLVLSMVIPLRICGKGEAGNSKRK
jgi:hypothetical protein